MPNRQRKFAYVSVSFMLTKLLFVLLYHIIYYTQVTRYTKLLYDIVIQYVPMRKLQNINANEILLDTDVPQNDNVPTTSVVEMKLCDDLESKNNNFTCTSGDNIAKLKCNIMEEHLNLCEPLLDDRQ